MAYPEYRGPAAGDSGLLLSLDFRTWPSQTLAVGSHTVEGYDIEVTGGSVTVGGGAGFVPTSTTATGVNIDLDGTGGDLGLTDKPVIEVVADIDQGGSSSTQVNLNVGQDEPNRVGLARLASVNVIRSSYRNASSWGANTDRSLTGSTAVYHLGIQVDGKQMSSRYSTTDLVTPDYTALPSRARSNGSDAEAWWTGGGVARLYFDNATSAEFKAIRVYRR